MKAIMRMAIAVWLLTGFQLMAAEDITARQISKAPVIDGKLDEEGWQGAWFADKFTILGTTNVSLFKTSAAVLYDDDNLYIGIICKTTNSAAIKAKIREMEEDVPNDDEVEVMIDPRTGGNEYLQVAVNAAGSRFDAWRTQKGSAYDASWGGNWAAAAHIGDGQWSCELKIPFALLGVKEGAAAPWRINICRRVDEPREHSSLAANGSFNEPDKFLSVNVLEQIRTVSPKPVYLVKPTVEIDLRDGKMCGVVRAVVTNVSAVAGKAMVCLEECITNKRVRINSSEIELRGNEGTNIFFDALVELVPVEGSKSLLQSDKALKVVVAGDVVRYEQSFPPLGVSPVQISVFDQVKPELKCETEFSKDGQGNKDGKIIITVEDPEAGNKTLARREYQLTEQVVMADFQKDKLPTGRLLARVCVKDSSGKPVCTQELVFAHLSKEPERLNNLVCRLEKGKVKSGKSGIKKIIFENPRQGWVWVRVSAKFGANPEGKEIVTVGCDGGEWMKISADGENETMRWLQDGTHRLTMSGTVAGEIDYEIRSVPKLILYYTGITYNPRPFKRENGTIGYVPYDAKYLKENGILREINGISSWKIGDNDRGFAEEWVRNGGKWLAVVTPPGKDGTDTKDDFTPEYVFKGWSENALINDALISGYFIDEFWSGEGVKHMRWLGGMRLMLADKRFKDKIIYPYLAGLYKDDPFISFIAGLYEAGAHPCFEWYPHEEPTEEQAYMIFEKCRDKMADYEKKIPGILKHSLFALAHYTGFGRYSNDVYPDVDYKVFLDLQFNMLANDPVFRDFGGVEWYTSTSDDETIRWCAALFRHYGLEGRRDKLSDQYGFKYKLRHIVNGDFDNGLEGWETRPGAEKTIAVKEIKNYGGKLQGLYNVSQGVGDHVLWMKRSPRGPNVVSQAVRGLESGRLYALKMISGNYGELMAGKSILTNHVLKVRMENVEIIPAESFVEIIRAGKGEYGFKSNGNPYCLNSHRIMFRAKGKNARLIISDWADGQNAGGPEGQELICNFIQIQPYFAKELR